MKTKMISAIIALVAISSVGVYFVTANSEISTQTILDTSHTIIDQDIQYPSNGAHITSKIVTVPPGVETGWHEHEYPLYAYVMDGQITVDYGDQYGAKTFVQGDSFVEAIQFSHNGKNYGDETAKILVVLLGEQ